MKYLSVRLFLLLSPPRSLGQYNDWKEYRSFYDIVISVLHPAEYDDLKAVKDSSALLLQ